MCSLMKYSVCTRMETRTVSVEARKAVTWMSLVPGSQLGYYGFILSSEYTRRILMNARNFKDPIGMSRNVWSYHYPLPRTFASAGLFRISITALLPFGNSWTSRIWKYRLCTLFTRTQVTRVNYFIETKTKFYF